MQKSVLYQRATSMIRLVAERPWVWGLFVAYLGAIAYLAVLGRRAARADKRSYAIGSVHPIVAGMTLAAAIASTATFVINPGFVYVHGLSAFMHFGVAAGLGMAMGLVLVCGRFRRLGASSGAVTLPQWIGKRFGSRGLSSFFALVNLLSLSFVVLIVGGLSVVMQTTLGLSNVASLVVVIVFVFGYVFLGGAYANAYANTLQAAIMAIVAIMIVGSGLQHLLLPSESLALLRGIDGNLASAVNPTSTMFSSWFSVYGAGFVIGFALMCQPHVMTTALYVKNDREVKTALIVGIGLAWLFAAVLLAGLYARLDGITPSAITDAAGNFRQDRVMAVYLSKTFSPAALALVTVAIVAAGMSTLSAILVSLSSIVGQDLWVGVVKRGNASPQSAQLAAKVVLVLMGVGAFLLALRPPQLLGVFGQLGAYGVVTAGAAPLVLGATFPAMSRRTAMLAAAVGPLLHFGLYFLSPRIGVVAQAAIYGIDLANPGVTAAIAIVVSALVASIGILRNSSAESAIPAA